METGDANYESDAGTEAEADEENVIDGEEEPVQSVEVEAVAQSANAQVASSVSHVSSSHNVAVVDENSKLFKSSPLESQKTVKSDGSKRGRNSDDEDDGDDGRSCPICMDIWSNSGNHRLASLRCGHFFGHSCIMRWLQIGCAAGQRRCPQCNKKANTKDIRVHYARKLQVLDTTERDRLREELESVQREKNRLELELARSNLNQQLHQQQITELRNKVARLQRIQAASTGEDVQTGRTASQRQLSVHRNVEICKEGECRVLAYNTWLNLLVVSQRSANNLFSGYGIKKIDTLEFRPIQFVFLHPKPIRDMAFHPQRNDILLSVSLDRCAKLFNVANNTVVQTYTADNPLWSCCWDADNTNLFFAGTSNGLILQYDVRFPNEPVGRLTSTADSSPVTSLAAVQSCPGRTLARGGILACRLNSCWAYERTEACYAGSQLPFDGPFISLCYDQESGHVLISTRPSGRFPHVRHIVCHLPQTTAGQDAHLICNPVHTFQGSTSQKLLSRPCQMTVAGDTLVAAHQESLKSVALWSLSSGQQVFNVPVSQPVTDLCSVQVNGSSYLAALSERILSIYSFK
ncbi:E3 ubiquitin-protein ligase rfwd3.L-like [Periplaneta americana]|uniref:E3 ubiquitin-protein ligase rfwd3.L-like n=1 Tax=Periplaneta americana TaxID=6978 RepID=UPI0037E91220